MLVSGARDIGQAMSCSSVSTLESYLLLTRAPVLGCAGIKISSFIHCGQQPRRWSVVRGLPHWSCADWEHDVLGTLYNILR